MGKGDVKIMTTEEIKEKIKNAWIWIAVLAMMSLLNIGYFISNLAAEKISWLLVLNGFAAMICFLVMILWVNTKVKWRQLLRLAEFFEKLMSN